MYRCQYAIDTFWDRSNRLPIRNFEPCKWGLVDDRLRSNHKRKAVIRKAKTALENPKQQAPAYKKMGYPLTALENPDRVLKGFNGSTTISVRDVVLPVEAVPVILNTKFSVVSSSKLGSLQYHPWSLLER